MSEEVTFRVFRGVGDAHGEALGIITPDVVDSFAATWMPLLKPSRPSMTGGCEHANDNKVAALTPEAINAIKAHFKWILGNTGQKEVTMAYLKKKVDGFDADNHWEIVTALFSALGLAMEHKSKKHAIELLRPVTDVDLQAATTELSAFPLAKYCKKLQKTQA